MTHEIRVPLPDPACSQNYHGHFRRRHQAMKDARVQAWASCKEAKIPKGHEHVTISAVWVLGKSANGKGGYRPRDVPNAIGAMKGTIDGIVDAGVIPDDDAKHLSIGSVTIVRRPDQSQSYIDIRLEITE